MKRMLAACALLSTSAVAQTLPTIVGQSSGVNWWLVAAGAAVVIVAGFVILKRKDPTLFGTVQTAGAADFAAFVSEARTLAQSIKDHASALIDNTKATAANTAAQAGAKAAPVEPAAPAAQPGKKGIAGALTLQVTGDLDSDLKAFLAAYGA